MNSEIENIKKTKTGIPIKNIWYMLLYALDGWYQRNQWKSEVENAPNINSLLVLILSKQIQQRMRIGLGHDYCKVKNEIYSVRGRIDFDKSIKLMSFEHGKIFSRYQVYLSNIKKNQIIKSTLTRMVQIGDFGKNKNNTKEIKNKLRCVIQQMNGIKTIEIKLDEIKRAQIDERDRDYSLMLSICYLLCMQLMPSENEGAHSIIEMDRDNFILYEIYEKFVSKFYEYHLNQWNVRPQAHLKWPSEGNIDYIPIMKPDIILERKVTKEIIIIDTKFTKEVLKTGQWGNLTFNRDHIFQIYAYLRTQEEISNNYKNSCGILIYPTVNKSVSQSVNIQGHNIKWITIDLTQHWEKIENDLLDIIKN